VAAAAAALADCRQPRTFRLRLKGSNPGLWLRLNSASVIVGGARRWKGGQTVLGVLGAAQGFNDLGDGFDVVEMFVQLAVVKGQRCGGREEGGERR
jgi:hypothetical protein